MHMARWCDGGRTQRSRVGSLTDKAVKSSKRRAAEASLDKVVIGSDPPLENVPHFQYLGSRLQGDGSDEADVGHRLEIAQSAFSTLSHLWADHRLSRTTKLRLYRVCVCSSLTHCCEAWTLTRAVTRSINGFNSRCMHVMTGEHYRETAIAPAYDLVLAVRRRHFRYLGHVLRMSAETPSCIQRAVGSVTVRALRCHNLWQWRRIVQCGAPKWRRCREPAFLSDDFLYYYCIIEPSGFKMNKCMYVCTDSYCVVQGYLYLE